MVADRITVTDVEVPCIIGIYSEERTEEQPLLVSLAFTLDTRRAAHEEALHLSVDYARVLGVVRFILTQGRFQLLETAAEVIALGVLATVPVVDELELMVKKPRALGGNGLPALHVTRARESASGRWTFPFGVVDVIWNALGFGLYHLEVRPGSRVALQQEVELFSVDAGRDGEALGKARTIHNGRPTTQHYLALARPPMRLDNISGTAR